MSDEERIRWLREQADFHDHNALRFDHEAQQAFEQGSAAMCRVCLAALFGEPFIVLERSRKDGA